MRISTIRPLLFAGAIIGAGNAFAVPITTWQLDVDMIFDTATVDPAGVTIVNNKKLVWGTPVNSEQSVLEITDSPITKSVNTDGPAVATVSVTHTNQPINGTSLNSVDIMSGLNGTYLSG